MSKITIDSTEVEVLVLDSVAKHISDRLNYNQVLGNMVGEALEDNRDKIQTILNETLNGVIANPVFKKTVKEEFERKVAKSLVGHLEGAVEKAANVYRQDPTLKSRMILAIENIISKAETPPPQEKTK